jgi:hypothetical protein
MTWAESKSALGACGAVRLRGVHHAACGQMAYDGFTNSIWFALKIFARGESPNAALAASQRGRRAILMRSKDACALAR